MSEVSQPHLQILSRPEEQAQKPKIDWNVVSVTLPSPEVETLFLQVRDDPVLESIEFGSFKGTTNSPSRRTWVPSVLNGPARG